MSAVVACGSCGRRFQVGDRQAGRTIACPNCGASLFVPQAEHQGTLDLGGGAQGDDALASLLGPSESPTRVAPAAPAAPQDGYALSPAPAPAPQPYAAEPVQHAAPLATPNAASYQAGFSAAPNASAPGDPLGSRLPPTKKPAKRAAQGVDWYFNPLWWAALLIPLVALVFVSMKLVDRLNAPPPKKKVIKVIGTSPPSRRVE